MNTKLVTIFGGSGFLGRHTVRALAKAGWRIKIATRHPARGFFLRPLGTVGQIDFVKCDVAEADSVAAAVAGADAVINLTGILFQKGQTFEDVQATGAANIAQAATAAGVTSLVHVSAIGANAESDSDYAVTKAQGEQAVREAFPDAVILRPSIIFGPEDGFFNLFANLARFSPFLPLIGGGHTKFQPAYVGDIAEAIARSVDGKVAGGKVYELGGPQVLTFRQCMEMMLEVIDRKRLLIPVPFAIASLQGALLGLLPNPLLTSDQVTLLKADNVVSPEAQAEGRTFAGLGITPQAAAAILPSYLWRYRPAGQFTRKTEA